MQVICISLQVKAFYLTIPLAQSADERDKWGRFNVLSRVDKEIRNNAAKDVYNI